jgi:hypothetical protein
LLFSPNGRRLLLKKSAAPWSEFAPQHSRKTPPDSTPIRRAPPNFALSKAAAPALRRSAGLSMYPPAFRSDFRYTREMYLSGYATTPALFLSSRCFWQLVEAEGRRQQLHLVIGTGQPRNLDFNIVSGHETIPADAQVYAIFSGAFVSDQLDEDLFDTMTDEEYYTFRALAQDAREREAESLRAAEHAARAESLLSKFRRWLLSGRPLADYSADKSLHGRRGATTTEARADMRSV